MPMRIILLAGKVLSEIPVIIIQYAVLVQILLIAYLMFPGTASAIYVTTVKK